MAKKDPRPIVLSAVGPITYTVPGSLNGVIVDAVEGGGVYREGTALATGDALLGEDILIFTPEVGGGTTTLSGHQPNQEFSGEYVDLEGAPPATPPASEDSAVAVLRSFRGVGEGYVDLSQIWTGGQKSARALSAIRTTLSSDALLPYVLKEINIFGVQGAPQGIKVTYVDFNANTPAAPGLSAVDEEYVLTSHSGQVESVLADTQLTLKLRVPVMLKPGGWVRLEFTRLDDVSTSETLSVLTASALPDPATDKATANGLTTVLYGADGSALDGRYIEMSGIVAQRSVYGVLFSDMFPVVRAPTVNLIGLEVVDAGGGAAKLRYRNAAGVVTEWPGTLPQ